MDVQGEFVRTIGDFYYIFKGFLVEFLEKSCDPERKSKTPRKSPEKWTFLSLAFYNAPSLHTVESTYITWGTKIKVFRVCLSGPFPPTLFASFFPPLSPSGPVPSHAPFPLPLYPPFFDFRKTLI